MIYIVGHKQFELPVLDDNYLVIYVGDKIKEFAKENGLLTDDCCNEDNIASKNATFCELTALYWIWKNDNSDSFVGLNHYRRFFLSKVKKGEFLAGNEIRTSLETYDIILPKKLKFCHTIRQFYCRTTGYEKDLKSLENIIEKDFPDYLEAYRYFLEGKEMVYANMFIMSKENLGKYCNWLFDILFQLEEKIDLKDYTQAEKRVFGYMGELLLNVWVIHNKLKVDYFEIINTEKTNNFKNNFLNLIKQIAKEIIYFPSGVPYRRRLKKGK